MLMHKESLSAETAKHRNRILAIIAGLAITAGALVAGHEIVTNTLENANFGPSSEDIIQPHGDK